VPVSVLNVQAEPFTATVAITGTLVSRARVDVKAETIGRVVRFDKQEGDPVAAGEPVVWLDEEDYRLATSVQVADQDARAQVSLAEAQLEQARATLAVARKRLRDALIRAPVAGELEKRFVNPGAYVEAPTQVFTIVDNRRLELESPVASTDLAPLRARQRVTFQVNSYPGEVFAGSAVEINPAVDAETRSAKVGIRRWRAWLPPSPIWRSYTWRKASTRGRSPSWSGWQRSGRRRRDRATRV
jgi:membrane fusion protein (multidrug efflux system)